MAADVNAFSNLESLLLFQSVAAYGNTADAFARISKSLRNSPILQRQPNANVDRLNPDALTTLYLRLLKAEAKRAIGDASSSSSPPSSPSSSKQSPDRPSASSGTIEPSSSKPNGISSPQLSSIEDAAAHRYLEPLMIDKLYTLYKDQVIQEIKEEENRYNQLLQEVQNLESQSTPSEQVNQNSFVDGNISSGSDAQVDAQKTASINSVDPSSKEESSVKTEGSLNPKSAEATAHHGTTAAAATADSRSPKNVDDSAIISSNDTSSAQQTRSKSSTELSNQHVKSSGQAPTSLRRSGSIRDYMVPTTPPSIENHARPAAQQQSISQSTHQSTLPNQSQSSVSKRTGGMQLPPFQVSPQIPSQAQQQSQLLNQKAAAASEASTSKAATPGTQTPSSIKSSKAPLASLLQEGQGVHYSPGSSTGWKVMPDMPDAATPRPGSISPLSERDSSPERPSKRRKTRGSAHEASKSKSALAAAKAQNQTPPVLATSSRDRSHSVASLADDAASVRSASNTSRRPKAEVSTPSANLPLPGNVRSTRATRSTPVPAPATAASPSNALTSKQSTKRKRASTNDPETPGPPSPRASDNQPSTLHTKAVSTEHNITDFFHHPTTIRASRNFHKASAPILNNIGSHKHASLFSQPVSTRTKGYYDIIKRPTDLSTIRKAISAGGKAVNAAISLAAAAAASTSASAHGVGQGSPGAPSALEVPPTPGGSGDSAHTVILPLSRELVPPEGIVNGAQLEQEITRMFANAVMFNEGDEGVVADSREMFAEVQGSVDAWKQAQSSSE